MGLDFGVWGLGIWGFGGLGFGVCGAVCGVWCLGFGVWGSGFGVWGLGFGVWSSVGFEGWGGFRVMIEVTIGRRRDCIPYRHL